MIKSTTIHNGTTIDCNLTDNSITINTDQRKLKITGIKQIIREDKCVNSAQFFMACKGWAADEKQSLAVAITQAWKELAAPPLVSVASQANLDAFDVIMDKISEMEDRMYATNSVC